MCRVIIVHKVFGSSLLGILPCLHNLFWEQGDDHGWQSTRDALIISIKSHNKILLQKKKEKECVFSACCVCSDQWHGCNRGSRLRKCTRASLVLVFVLRLRAIHHPMLLYREIKKENNRQKKKSVLCLQRQHTRSPCAKDRTAIYARPHCARARTLLGLPDLCRGCAQPNSLSYIYSERTVITYV